MTAKEKHKVALGHHFQKIAQMLLEMPLDTPIEFTYNDAPAAHKDYSVVGIVQTINMHSLRIELLAVNIDKPWPWPVPDTRGFGNNKKANIGKVDFIHIVKWKRVPREDLPVFVGHKIIYPRLQRELEKGA